MPFPSRRSPAAGPLCFLALLCLHAAHAAVIWGVSPNRGSLMGGTQLTITGTGFSRDHIQVCAAGPLPFPHALVCVGAAPAAVRPRPLLRCRTRSSSPPTQGSTIVYLGNDVCEQVEYWTSDEQIVCITPPHAYSEGVQIS